jgi:hypothetical protein
LKLLLEVKASTEQKRTPEKICWPACALLIMIVDCTDVLATRPGRQQVGLVIIIHYYHLIKLYKYFITGRHVY